MIVAPDAQAVGDLGSSAAPARAPDTHAGLPT